MLGESNTARESQEKASESDVWVGLWGMIRSLIDRQECSRKVKHMCKGMESYMYTWEQQLV